jgi:hypothetical protein
VAAEVVEVEVTAEGGDRPRVNTNSVQRWKLPATACTLMGEADATQQIPPASLGLVQRVWSPARRALCFMTTARGTRLRAGV